MPALSVGYTEIAVLGDKYLFLVPSALPCSGRLVGQVKEFSLLLPRSDPLLTRAVVRKYKSRGLPLLSLGSCFQAENLLLVPFTLRNST